MSVDLFMVTLWGIASLLNLFSVVMVPDWLGLAGVALCGFIAFAYAVDFDRIARATSVTTKTRRLLLLSICTISLVIAAGGHMLGSLGIDLHWRKVH